MESGVSTQEVYQDLPETNDISQIQDVFFPCCFLELTEIDNSRDSQTWTFQDQPGIKYIDYSWRIPETRLSRNEMKSKQRQGNYYLG